MIFVCLLVGCAKFSESNQSSTSTAPKPDPATKPDPLDREDPSEKILNYETLPALPWESLSADYRQWSLHIYEVLWEERRELLESEPADAHKFCAKYRQLSLEERLEFWARLLVVISKYESSYRPGLRYLERGLGNDLVTGEPIVSEGLLQLSYQDHRYYEDCPFDWTQDRLLARVDPSKTILQPFNNLTCGLSILQSQIRNKGSIALTSGAYWSVLKVGHANSKVGEIQSLLNGSSFCH